MLATWRTTLAGITILPSLAASALAQSERATPLPDPPGRLVDIGGGQRLHLHCTGRGSPTVVFENGAGDFSVIWTLVQPRVAEVTRACSYDRGGYAWSDPGTQPRTYDQLALELHSALARAGERGPYVLVGQSYGGLVVRGFARRYATDVVGMVLVDAVHEDQRITMGGTPQRIRDFATGRVRPEPRIVPDSALIAIRRASPTPIAETGALDPPLDRLSPGNQRTWRLASADSVYRRSWAAEMDWSPEELTRMHVERATTRATLGALPLIVLSRTVAGSADSLAVERAALQRDLATLSTQGKHIVAPHSGHNIHLEDPELVVRAIRDVVTTVRRAERPKQSSAGTNAG